MASERPNINAGHRQRMYQRFERQGCSFADFHPHEALEMFLFLFIPRENTNHTAHYLLNKFGSLEKVFDAPVEELIEIKGIGKKTAENIRLFGELFNDLASTVFCE